MCPGPKLGPGHSDTVSKSYDSASKDFVGSFASRSQCCFGSASWWFCIQRGGERNHVNWLFFLVLWRPCLLSWVYCLPVCFLNALRESLPKHSWRKTILLLSKLTLACLEILKLAGPDCLFENTLHDTFFISLIGFLKNNQPWSKQRKKKAAINLSSKQQSRKYWSRQARHVWTNLALPCVAGTQSFEKPYKNRWEKMVKREGVSWFNHKKLFIMKRNTNTC